MDWDRSPIIIHLLISQLKSKVMEDYASPRRSALEQLGREKSRPLYKDRDNINYERSFIEIYG